MPYRSPADPRKQRHLPMLDRLTIKTPCNASWEGMIGDDRVRHCCQCNRNVYDLRAMDPDEAEAFLEEHLATTGWLPCARLYRRPDGRLMTSQCPTAADRRHRARVVGGIAAIATVTAAVAFASRPVLGPEEPVVVDREKAAAHDVEPPHPHAEVMGAIASRDDDDDDDDGRDHEWRSPPPLPGPKPVSVTLRAEKAPLLWSAARR